jgi:hypothetical protein
VKRLWIVGLVVLAVAASACGGGYTQGEVDALVAEAVGSAAEESQDELISEAEAQAQVLEAENQASLQAAVDTCTSSSSGGDSYITVDAGGMFMEGKGAESPGTSYETIACVLAELNTPSSVIGRIDNTNSTMGLVEGSWGIYEADWSYHPDNGLAIHIQVTS